MVLVLLLVLPSWFCQLKSQDEVSVGLYYKDKFRSFKLELVFGNLNIIRDGREVKQLGYGSKISIDVNGSNFHVYSDFEDYGESSDFQFIPENGKPEYYLQCTSPLSEKKWLNGSLHFMGGKPFILAKLPLEDYVGGVVQAESGIEQGTEYYMVQATISRTFLLTNWNKHRKEGFSVCDHTHCQVFHGLSKLSPYIKEGVNRSKGMVLVDKNLNLIDAVFHSNCGGATLNSEDYWSAPLPYLRNVIDSLCYEMPHAEWQRTIPKQEWLGYLQHNHGFPVQDSAALSWATSADYIDRGKYYRFHDWHVPLRTIRRDWKLRSTFFRIVDLGDNIRIEGKGFGHGVGLCQEGAMVRAKLENRFYDILHHYYQDVFIVDKNMLDTYKKDF